MAILLDGLPAPGGFALKSISPDLVECIKIRRAASAETSSPAVAGSINVILRRAGAAALRAGYARPCCGIDLPVPALASKF